MSDGGASKNIKEELQRIAGSERVSHAYIFEGEDRGLLLENAKAFAKMLQAGPADVIFPEHEKPNLISVEDIRTVNRSVYIRPYGSLKKVYIIEEAEKMNEAAQNALLKTLEEPPEYIVFLLLTFSAKALLETIRSRSVKILMDTEERLLAEDEDTKEAQALVLDILKSAPNMDARTRISLTERAVKLKNRYEFILSDLTGFIRDVLYYKASKDPELIADRSREALVKLFSERVSYEGADRILEELKTVRRRMDANVNMDITLEILLDTIRGEAGRK